MTERTPGDNQYPDDWWEVSNAIRAARRWTCEDCEADLSKRSRVLDAHHLDGQRANCATKNLRVLCRLCHIERHPDNFWLPFSLSIEDERYIRASRPLDQMACLERKKAFYAAHFKARMAAAQQRDQEYVEVWGLLIQAEQLYREHRPMVLLAHLKRMIEGKRVALVDESQRAHLASLCAKALEDVQIRDELASQWERERGISTSAADIERALSLIRSSSNQKTGWETDHPLRAPQG